MSDSRTLRLGRMKLATVPGVKDDDLTAQLASGFDAEGVPVVMLRIGPAVIALTIAGASDLADALKVEAALVTIENAKRGN